MVGSAVRVVVRTAAAFDDKRRGAAIRQTSPA